MSLASRFFRWHRWLAYLVALQVLAWVLGGLLFAWLPFQAWVKAKDLVARPTVALPPGWAQPLAAALPDGQALQGVQAVATACGTAWRLQTVDGERWLSADGRALPPPDADAVARFAQQLYRGSGRALPPQRLDEVPPRLGLVREVAPGRAVWRAGFDDALATRLYVDARSGELLAVRTEAWVWYDFFWRFHVMDWTGGEDFNNPWLRAASLAAVALALCGLVLMVLALRRGWRGRGRRAVSRG